MIERTAVHACSACGNHAFSRPTVCYWCRPENATAIAAAQRLKAKVVGRKAAKKKAVVTRNPFLD